MNINEYEYVTNVEDKKLKETFTAMLLNFIYTLLGEAEFEDALIHLVDGTLLLIYSFNDSIARQPVCDEIPYCPMITKAMRAWAKEYTNSDTKDTLIMVAIKGIHAFLSVIPLND
ncbi:uncharacterized protein LOC135946501 [Cloeon dipterum]|uniref:uncharacterized protein LOC135946501 n=1 Tax=Cloeon dipterum TaxID=197152 RepID=UPI0032206883